MFSYIQVNMDYPADSQTSKVFAINFFLLNFFVYLTVSDVDNFYRNMDF